jgi:estrone sulfotransferase
MIHWLKTRLDKPQSAHAPVSSACPVIHGDDCFLVSYPKSGNTWMRFLLANLLRSTEQNADAEPIDFHTAVRYVPEYELHTAEVDAAPRPRILKSHTPYVSAFPRVLYLIRDPRDVYVSYYHYMRKRLPGTTSFAEFLRMDGLHPCHWDEHVAGWIDRPTVLVIRYEDILADTHAQLGRCVDFWGGRSFSDEQIDHAVRASSFDQMKQIEQQKGRPFQNEAQKKQSTPFMRKGKSGDWVNYFDHADRAYLDQRCGDFMERFGYGDGNTYRMAG